jgi:hypothetical protein
MCVDGCFRRLTAARRDGLVSSEEWCMSIEDQLRERLKKVEALYFGATTVGEREAADAALARLKAKLAEAGRRDPPIEMKFSLPDQWSVRLFIALCRRYGLKPFRYPRQRATTVMVKGPRHFLETVLWRQFNELHADLWQYLEQTTERVIRETVHADTTDAETAAEAASLR